MNLHFYKYQGTGNDFILIDNRKEKLRFSASQVAALCNRRFGIGADGLMLLEHESGFDFRMVYFNSDGNKSTMCGNGGRCMVAFAEKLGIVKGETRFMAIDGPHHAEVSGNGVVSLEMISVENIFSEEEFSILDTGSPHYIRWVSSGLQKLDVLSLGRAVRNQAEFQPGGINVNFVQPAGKELWVRTYERGVEDETLSCGTGVTAAAIAFTRDKTGAFKIPVKTPGGALEVSFDKSKSDAAENIWLTGPAVFVFEGYIEI